MWSAGWDYLRNYSCRDATASFEATATMADINQLVGALNELNRMNSGAERAAWVTRNYGFVLRVSKSLFGRFIKVFHHSGPLREVVEGVQREVVEGGLLRDCLEIGSNDLKVSFKFSKKLLYSTPQRLGMTNYENLQPYSQLLQSFNFERHNCNRVKKAHVISIDLDPKH